MFFLSLCFSCLRASPLFLGSGLMLHFYGLGSFRGGEQPSPLPPAVLDKSFLVFL